MKLYTSNYRFKVAALLGLSFSLVCLILSLAFVAFGKNLPLLLFAVGLILLLFILFKLPREIEIAESVVKFKTILRSKEIRIEDINKVKAYYSTKSMVHYGNDKSRAHMLCLVSVKNRPWGFQFFGNSINNYKTLYNVLRGLVKSD